MSDYISPALLPITLQVDCWWWLMMMVLVVVMMVVMMVVVVVVVLVVDWWWMKAILDENTTGTPFKISSKGKTGSTFLGLYDRAGGGGGRDRGGD